MLLEIDDAPAIDVMKIALTLVKEYGIEDAMEANKGVQDLSHRLAAFFTDNIIAEKERTFNLDLGQLEGMTLSAVIIIGVEALRAIGEQHMQ